MKSSLSSKIHTVQSVSFVDFKRRLYSVQKYGNSWRTKAKNKAWQLLVEWGGRVWRWEKMRAEGTGPVGRGANVPPYFLTC